MFCLNALRRALSVKLGQAFVPEGHNHRLVLRCPQHLACLNAHHVFSHSSSGYAENPEPFCMRFCNPSDMFTLVYMAAWNIWAMRKFLILEP